MGCADNGNYRMKLETITPKGIIPNISRLLGYLWVGYAISAGLYGLYLVWENGYSRITASELYVQLLESVLGVLLFVLLFSLPGLLLSGLFPSVQFNENGFTYKSLFLRGFIHWSEIETVARVTRPTECLAVVISRPFSLLNGLWFSSLYGRLVGIGKPVVLLSIMWEDRDELLQKIREQQSNSSER